MNLGPNPMNLGPIPMNLGELLELPIALGLPSLDIDHISVDMLQDLLQHAS